MLKCLYTEEPLQTGTPENRKPLLSVPNFCFLIKFTPLNQTFSLVQRVFSLEGLHSIYLQIIIFIHFILYTLRCLTLNVNLFWGLLLPAVESL